MCIVVLVETVDFMSQRAYTCCTVLKNKCGDNNKSKEIWKKFDARRTLGEGSEKWESHGKTGGLASMYDTHSLRSVSSLR